MKTIILLSLLLLLSGCSPLNDLKPGECFRLSGAWHNTYQVTKIGKYSLLARSIEENSIRLDKDELGYVMRNYTRVDCFNWFDEK
jgi:hypothetical protein